MKKDIEIANKKLIDAFKRDTQLYKKLEKSGKLFKGYDPDMRKCHEENAELLASYIKKYGWPLPSKYGRKVYEAAWFIAIHAISKPKILKQALNTLEEALHKGENVASEYARLFDRIELYEGRQQIYGTQFFPSPNGFYPRNLKDPDNVDKRRASIGLSTCQAPDVCSSFRLVIMVIMYNGFRDWRSVIKRAMWPNFIVMFAPVLNNNFSFIQGVK